VSVSGVTDLHIVRDAGGRFAPGGGTAKASKGGGSRKTVLSELEAKLAAAAMPASPDERVLLVDVAKVDTLWAQEPDFHIAPAASGANFKLDRAKAFASSLKPGSEFKAPQLGVSKDSLGFEDGRHRFAAMRDLGLKTVPVSMDKQSAQNARARGLLVGIGRRK
jgi:hypothetical protein